MSFKTDYNNILNKEKNLKKRLKKILDLAEKIENTKSEYTKQKDSLETKIKDCDDTLEKINKSLSAGQHDVSLEVARSPELQDDRDDTL